MSVPRAKRGLSVYSRKPAALVAQSTEEWAARVGFAGPSSAPAERLSSARAKHNGGVCELITQLFTSVWEAFLQACSSRTES